MHDTRSDDLELALSLVAEASRIAADAFATPRADAGIKADGTDVTAVDVEIEDLFRARLAAVRPGDGILGEERGETPGSTGRRWITDPIGGTADFARRIPLFSVDLALEDADGPAVAVSGMPMSRMLMAAARGRGAFTRYDDGTRIPARVDDRAELDGAVVCAHALKAWPEPLLTALHRRCALRDGVHSVHRLITGRAHAVILAGAAMGYDDIACLPVLVEEAGGRVTDLSGRPVLRGDGTVLATNGVLHEEFLALVAR